MFIYVLLQYVFTAAVSAKTCGNAKNVVLISIDGLHHGDLDFITKNLPSSRIAQFAAGSIEYSQTLTSNPSDSFPGLAALITGGSPASHGFYYDAAYSRKLFDLKDVKCTNAGVAIFYDESVDLNDTIITGGCSSEIYSNGCGIDPANLPRNIVNGKCVPWYAHNEIRVNTIFEVAKAANVFTAWTDKHPIYEFVNGPSGAGVMDLFTPEINAVSSKDMPGTVAYDATHANAIVNWINGKDHAGNGTLAGKTNGFLIGGNFQSVSVGQKLHTTQANTTGGYLDASFTPTPTLAVQFAAVDKFIGQIVDALKATNQWSNTLMIVTAKHGQSPVDVTKWTPVSIDGPSDPLTVAAAHAGIDMANITYTNDDVMLIWLKDGTMATALYNAISKNLTAFHADSAVAYLKYGKDVFGADPATDSKVPDLVLQPNYGVIYSTSTAKDAEHGGSLADDRHVGLLVGGGVVSAGAVVASSISTQQVAASIMQALGLKPSALQAVAKEGVAVLPGLFDGCLIATSPAPTGTILHSSAKRNGGVAFATAIVFVLVHAL
ncbi:hypothetical protein HDU98_008324 [Podochytrium sp. JEL0797]|nr:hypothetical protein HDU98_008324 [Podochytrium sp. JEL0797]